MKSYMNIKISTNYFYLIKIIQCKEYLELQECYLDPRYKNSSLGRLAIIIMKIIIIIEIKKRIWYKFNSLKIHPTYTSKHFKVSSTDIIQYLEDKKIEFKS